MRDHLGLWRCRDTPCLMLRSLTLLILVSLITIGCKRPSPEQCLDICRKYNELQLWELFEKESADMNEVDKAASKAKTEALIKEIRDREFDPGLRNCVTSCKRGADRALAKCMDEATSAAVARDCIQRYAQ